MVHRRRRSASAPGPRRLALLAVAMQLAVACNATPSEELSPSPGPTATVAPTPAVPRGGTLRLVVPANDETVALTDVDVGDLDPQRGFVFAVQGLTRCCRFRTLVSHNGLSVEEGGARLHPDLAETLPEVSADGLTWTFRLKRGLHYGPPLEDMEITAADIIRSLHRLLSPEVSGGFLSDLSDIDGAAEFSEGSAASISGLEAPDAHTVVIRLAGAQGDFGARVAEWGTTPLPPDPVRPDAPLTEGTADDGSWRYLVSSGPYLLEGTEELDLSVPPEQRRLPSGVGKGRLVLVRNPSWDPSTDELRPAYPDRIEIELVESMEAAIARIDAGTADVVWNPIAPPQIPAMDFAAFQADPSRGKGYVNDYGGVRGLIINVAVPPFDDIHVRRAMNWVIDKAGLVEIQGGPSAARVFGHLAPDAFLDGLLLDYDPFGTPGGRGDLEKAKAEMALSRYDSDGDGLCDTPVCERIAALTRKQFSAVAEAAAGDLRQLGLGIEVSVLENDPFFASNGDAAGRHALWLGLGFGSAYISATGFMTNFSGRRSIGEDFGNGTMVGATPEQLRNFGYQVTEVPILDDRIEACIPLIGAAQFQCWAAVDQYLMENVVPWVPYSQDRFATVTGPRVVHYGFDELATTIALDQFALQP
jgi:peptide/nickel transport system substrate-binding protein